MFTARRMTGLVVLAGVVLLGATYAAGDSYRVAFDRDGDLRVEAGGRALAPHLAVTDDALQGFRVGVSLDALLLRSRETTGGAFFEVDWENASRHGAVGTPELPVARRLFVVPPGMQVELRVRSGAARVVTTADLGFAPRVVPRQAPVPKLPGALEAAPFDFDADIYAQDAELPAKRAVVEEVGIMNGQRVCMLEVRPVSCNPAAQTLTLWPELEVEVRFTGQVAASEPFDVSPMLRRQVLNPALLPQVTSAGGRYFIAVASAYQSGITAFAAAKQGQGHLVTTHVVAPGTSNTAIKSAIQSWYSGPAEAHYVLLVGDTDTIPHWTGGGEGSPATDSPYGCMDAGDDWLPEIAVGRFSVRSAAQLAAIVDKTLYYENGALADPDYLKRAVFMASTDNYQISEGTHNWVINNYMDPNAYISDKLYTVTYGATTQDVRNSFNAGRFYGIYSGHGGTYSWADGPPFEQSDINGLINANMYPYVFSFACITGTYTVDECFTETWSRAANRGSVAVYGSSVNSYWTEDDILEKRLFDSIFDESDAVPSEVGPVWNDTRMRYLAEMGSGATTRRYFEMYNLLGDPSLRFPGSCTDAGALSFDRAKYACDGSVTVTLNDCGLNTNDSAVEMVVLDIESDSESGIEQVTLIETDPASAEFTGSIALSTVNAPGVLLVAAGDNISVKYIDEDDGAGGTFVPVTAMAVVDCTPPVVTNIHVTDIEPRSATVRFDGNEPVRGTVQYGTSCGALNLSATGSGHATSAAVNVSGLNDDTTYYYAVTAEDEAGNAVYDDNAGTCYLFTTPEVPDFFTELFDAADNDLDLLSLSFTPNGGNDFYAACAEAITSLPTDPAGGTVLSLSDDAYATVTLSGGATVTLYGQTYSTFYPVSNGYITFVNGESGYNESLAAHLGGVPKISALFDDLNPSSQGTISWKQLADRVAVTWQNVPEYQTSNSNTFQIVLYFDGRIEISYLAIAAADGLAGLSAGAGVDPDFFESDLSAMGGCGPQPPVASGASLTTPANQALAITIQATDDGLPVPPGALNYVLVTLPLHGTLVDPNAGAVLGVPYTLASGGRIVQYLPDVNYYGQDSFKFLADDGGVPPEGGESNVATVQILVQARPPVTSNLNVEVAQDTAHAILLQGSDPDGDVLDFVITSLPQEGQLSDPQAGAIDAVPYTLAGTQHVVVYTPDAGHLGDDAFTYHAEDGIFASADSTVSIFVKAPPPQIVTQYMADGFINEPYWMQLQASGGQPPLVWSVVSDPVYVEADLGQSHFAETGVARGWRADDAYWWYDLPFAFPFYEEAYTRIRVWSNGFIDFGSHTGSSYGNSDALLIANKRIAPLWDDLKTTGAGDDIYIDTSLSGAVTIRWDASHYASSTTEIRVALTLFADGAIRFDYGPGNAPITPSVGVSNGNGAQYTLCGYNGATDLGGANSVLLRIPQGLPEGLTLSADGALTGTPLEGGAFEPVFRVTDSLGRTDEKVLGFAIAVQRFGDCDFDGDIDLVDYAALQRCFTGDGNGPAPVGCEMFYADGDTDIDLLDSAAFVTELGN